MEEVQIDQEPSDACVFTEQGRVHVGDISDKTPPTSKLLAISNKYGLLFVASNSGLACIKSSNILKAAKKGSPGIIKAEDVTRVSITGVISHVALSNDQLTIAIGCGTSAYLCEVVRISQGDAKLVSVDFGSTIQDLCWSPSKANSFVVQLVSGEVILYDKQTNQKTTVEAGGCTSVCLGREQLFYGKEDGSISVYGVEAKKAITSIPLPESLSGQPFIAYTLHLVERYLVVVYQTAGEGEKMLSSTFFYELADGVVKSIYFRYAEYMELALESTYHISYINEWKHVILGHNNSSNIAVLKIVDNKLVELELPESGRASLPLRNNADTHLLGMGLDFTCEHPPAFFLFNDEGDLSVFLYDNKEAPLKSQAVAPLSSSSTSTSFGFGTTAPTFGTTTPTLFGTTTSETTSPFSTTSGGAFSGSTFGASTPAFGTATSIFGATGTAASAGPTTSAFGTAAKASDSKSAFSLPSSSVSSGAPSVFGSTGFNFAPTPAGSSATPAVSLQASTSGTGLAGASTGSSMFSTATGPSFSSGSGTNFGFGTGFGTGSSFGTGFSTTTADSKSTNNTKANTAVTLPTTPALVPPGPTVPKLSFPTTQPPNSTTPAAKPVTVPFKIAPNASVPPINTAQINKSPASVPAFVGSTSADSIKPVLPAYVPKSNVAADVKGPLEAQVKSFGLELNKLRQLRASVTAPPVKQISDLQSRTEILSNIFGDVSKGYKDMGNKVNTLRTQYLAGIAAIEEIRSLLEAQNDPTMQELLFMRRLDPESVASRTKMINTYQDIENKIATLGEHLEQMWATRRSQQSPSSTTGYKPSPTRGSSALKQQNSMEHIYRTLTSHYNIACQQASYVDDLGALFNNLVLSKQAITGSSRLRIATPPRAPRTSRITTSPSPAKMAKQQRMNSLRDAIAARVSGSNNQQWQVVEVTSQPFQLAPESSPVSQEQTIEKLKQLSKPVEEKQVYSPPKVIPTTSSQKELSKPALSQSSGVPANLPSIFVPKPATAAPSAKPAAFATAAAFSAAKPTAVPGFVLPKAEDTKPVFSFSPQTPSMFAPQPAEAPSSTTFSFPSFSTSSPATSFPSFAPAKSQETVPIKPKETSSSKSERTTVHEVITEEEEEEGEEGSDEESEEYEEEEEEEEEEAEGGEGEEEKPTAPSQKSAQAQQRSTTTTKAETPATTSSVFSFNPSATPSSVFSPSLSSFGTSSASTATTTPPSPVLPASTTAASSKPATTTSSSASSSSSSPSIFGTSSTPSVFGSAPFTSSSPSIFGTSSTPSIFDNNTATTPATSVFGSTSSTPSIFGSTNTSKTENSSASTTTSSTSTTTPANLATASPDVTAAPATATPASPAVTPSTTTPTPTPAATTTTTPATTTAFGQSSTLFSTPSTTSIFGGSTSTPATSSIFGAQTAPSTSAFPSTSAPATPSIFGSSASSGSAFGNTSASTTSIFGSASTPAAPSIFGSTSTPTNPAVSPFGGSGFGTATTPSAFGQASTTGQSQPAPAQTGSSGLNFGGFGLGGAAPTSSAPSNPFARSTPPAASTATPASTSAFGQSAFGSTTSGSSPFGSAFGSTSTPTSAFGTTPTPAPAFGATSGSSPFGSAFGSTSTPTSAFGSTNTPTSAFGSTNTPTSAFGATSNPSSAFGAAFGSTSTPTSAFGGFGANSPAPSAPGAATRTFGSGGSGGGFGALAGGGGGGFGGLAQQNTPAAPPAATTGGAMWAPRK